MRSRNDRANLAFGLVTLGLLGIIGPLIEGRERGWPTWSLVCLAASVPLLGLFVAHQVRSLRRGGSPLIDLRLFRDRAFSLGVGMTLLYNSGMASYFLLFAIYLQQGRYREARELLSDMERSLSEIDPADTRSVTFAAFTHARRGATSAPIRGCAPTP